MFHLFYEIMTQITTTIPIILLVTKCKSNVIHGKGHFKPFSPILYSNYNASKGTSKKICLRRHLKKITKKDVTRPQTSFLYSLG